MPYGRPIIKSISQNYQEAEVTLLLFDLHLTFLNCYLTFHFHFLNLHNLLLNLLIKERDVLLSCEVEALGENLVIWKQGDRTISAGSIMVSHTWSYLALLGHTWSYLVIHGHTWSSGSREIAPYLLAALWWVILGHIWSYLVKLGHTWSHFVILGQRTISAGSIMVSCIWSYLVIFGNRTISAGSIIVRRTFLYFCLWRWKKFMLSANKLAKLCRWDSLRLFRWIVK